MLFHNIGVLSIYKVSPSLPLAKLSVSEVRKIFHKMKDPVFGKSFFSKTSSTEAYTAILQETFGSMTMDEVKFPRC